MTSAGLLVVGASQAGVQLAASVRELGWTEPVTLVGAEAHQPYARPALSKAFLAGKADVGALALRDPSWFERERVGLHLGQRVTDVDLRGDGSGVAHTSSGLRLPFDRLALATGAAPRRLALPGAELGGVLGLRGLDDARALQDALRCRPRVVVVGGGFVGLEVAGSAAAAGCSVTVLEAGPSVMGRAVSRQTASFVQGLHQATGVRVLTGVAPTRFLDDGRGRVAGVELGDGELLPASLVVVGVGVVPVDDLARAAGLRCSDGIEVDELSRASDGHTLAVGDCANLPDPSPLPGSRARLRLESVDNAVEQARAAASTVVGQPRPYRSVPWFWSDQPGAKLQIAGLADASDELEVRPGSKPGQQVVLRFRGERLAGAECVNAPADFLTVRGALAAGLPVDRAALVSAPRLKDVLGRPPADRLATAGAAR